MVAYLAYVFFPSSLYFMNVFCKRKPTTCLRELLTRFCYGPGASMRLASVLLITGTGLFCAGGVEYKDYPVLSNHFFMSVEWINHSTNSD